jgi:hypothetical protein
MSESDYRHPLMAYKVIDYFVIVQSSKALLTLLKDRFMTRVAPRAAKWLTAACILSAIMSTAAHAAPRRYVNNIVGARPSAMGNAFTAVSDDANALYYNPAGLARLETWHVNLLNVQFGFNEASRVNYGNLMEIIDSGQGSSKSSSEIIDSWRAILSDLSGENHYARLGLNPNFVMKNFGIGAYTGAEIEVVPHTNGLPSILDVSLTADTHLRIGGAYTFFGRKLSVGSTLNFHLRAGAILDEFSVFDIADTAENDEALQNDLEEILSSGYGIGSDVGLLFTPIELWQPTLGISINNIGDTSFTYYEVLEEAVSKKVPTPIRQAVNVGLSLTPSWGPYFVRGAMDFREINLPIPASKKLGIGIESGIKGRWLKGSLMAGLSEGYLTGGFEADLLFLALRYSTYVTDRGFIPTYKAERRHLIELKVLF